MKEKKEIVKILNNKNGWLRWDYGFGECGLGAYLWFHTTCILFIKDNEN